MRITLAILFSLLMMTTSLAGCFGDTESTGNSEQTCENLDLVTHKVVIDTPRTPNSSSYTENEPIFSQLIIHNSDLTILSDSTQILIDGVFWNLTPYRRPFFDNHTIIPVEDNFHDGERQNTVLMLGNYVCVIENPDILLSHDGRGDRRICSFDTFRMENGSYEYREEHCNHVTTQHLDRTSTIRGGVESPQNLVNPENCAAINESVNVYNSSFVGVNLSVSGSWGHFSEGNEFRIYEGGVRNINDNLLFDTYYVNASFIRSAGLGMNYKVGIHGHYPCNIAIVQLYGDENLTEPASLSRNLTTIDTWEVIAEGCSFERSAPFVGETQLGMIHLCQGVELELTDDYYELYPDYNQSVSNNSNHESSLTFFQNLTQAYLYRNYSQWHSMLADNVYYLNSPNVMDKGNLTEDYFANMTSLIGTIELENDSFMDLSQSNYAECDYPALDDDVGFDWLYRHWSVWQEGLESPLAESIRSNPNAEEDSITLNLAENQHDYLACTWLVAENNVPMIEEYLITVILEYDDNGQLSVIAIPDYTVIIVR